MIAFVLMFLSGSALGFSQIYWHRKTLVLLGAGLETHLVISLTVITMLGAGSLLAKKHLSRPLRSIRLAEGLTCVLGALCLLSRIPSMHPFGTVAALAVSSLLTGTVVPLLSTATNSSFLKAYGPHTLGTAFAFFCFPFTILHLGLEHVLLLSITLNALTVLLSCRLPKSEPITHQPDVPSPPRESSRLVASFLWGTVAMGGQALMLHYLTIATSGASVLFYLGFGCYILGLGLSTLLGKLNTKAALLLAAAVLALFGPILSWVVTTQSITLILAYVTLMSVGLGLPFSVQLARSPKNAEFDMYGANFLGGALGVVCFAYLAPGAVSMVWVEVGCVFLTGLVLLLLLRTNFRLHHGLALAALISMGLVLGHHKYERLQTKTRGSPPFRHTKESRYGTISIDHLDRVYANGAFVGAFNIDPENFHNRIFRSYAIQSFLVRPSRVLLIGLGSGSWAASLVQNGLVEKLTVVELDASYGDIAALDKTNAALLAQRKVQIIYRDARQWLAATAEHYDLIIQNTTFHWQLNISHLMSLEFMTLAKSRLAPGGFYAFNATGSPHAAVTAAQSFKHFSRIANFIIGSDSPRLIDQHRLRSSLANGKPTLSPQLEHILRLAQRDSALVNGFESGSSILKRSPAVGVMTDDSLQSEFYKPLDVFLDVFRIGGY
jgi:predicted membrane-bound spermidine synthase